MQIAFLFIQGTYENLKMIPPPPKKKKCRHTDSGKNKIFA